MKKGVEMYQPHQSSTGINKPCLEDLQREKNRHVQTIKLLLNVIKAGQKKIQEVRIRTDINITTAPVDQSQESSDIRRRRAPTSQQLTHLT